MGYIEDSCADAEVIRYRARFHWLYNVQALILALTVVLSPFALAMMVRKWTTEIGVTDRRFVFKTGLISRKTEEVNLSRIEEMNLRQGIIGRMFGYGVLHVSGTGGNTITTPSIDDPLQLRKEIANAKDC